jgi:hypothetical protein
MAGLGRRCSGDIVCERETALVRERERGLLGEK